MKAPALDRELFERVIAIVGANDPTMLQRSCAALDMILADNTHEPMV